MPRPSEIQAEENATPRSPLRRSCRIVAVSAPAPSEVKPVKGRRLSTASNDGRDEEVNAEVKAAGRTTRASSVTKENGTNPEPAKTRGRRNSAASESSIPEEKKPAARGRRPSITTEDTEIETSKPVRGRRPSVTKEETEIETAKPVRGRRPSITKEETEIETAKPTRGRRTSVTKEETEEKKLVKGRRNSIQEEDEGSVKKPEELPLRSTRSRSSMSRDDADEVEITEKRTTKNRRLSVEEKAAEPAPRTPSKLKRRLSVTENAVVLDPIDEKEHEHESPTKQEPSVILAKKKPDLAQVKANLDLSVISESEEAEATRAKSRLSKESENIEDSDKSIEEPKVSTLSTPALEEGRITPDTLKSEIIILLNKSLDEGRKTPDSPARRSPRLIEKCKSGEKHVHMKCDCAEPIVKIKKVDFGVKENQEPATKSPDKENVKTTSDDVFLPGIVASEEITGTKTHISDGSDGSFQLKLSESKLQYIEDETDLNDSKLSENSDKENIDSNGKHTLPFDKKVLENLTDLGNKEIPLQNVTTVARVSNVFRPKDIDYSYMEPMDVDTTINTTKFEKINESLLNLSVTPVESPSEKDASTKNVETVEIDRKLQNVASEMKKEEKMDIAAKIEELSKEVVNEQEEVTNTSQVKISSEKRDQLEETIIGQDVIEEKGPTEVVKSPAKQKQSPTKEEKGVTKEVVSLANIEKSPVKEVKGPAQIEKSVTKVVKSLAKQEQSLTEEETIPSKEEIIPTREETSPTKEETSPSKEEIIPTKEETSPTKEETSRTKEETNPTKGETSPTKQEKIIAKKDISPTTEETITTTEETITTTEETITTTEETIPTKEVENPTKEDKGFEKEEKSPAKKEKVTKDTSRQKDDLVVEISAAEDDDDVFDEKSMSDDYDFDVPSEEEAEIADKNKSSVKSKKSVNEENPTVELHKETEQEKPEEIVAEEEIQKEEIETQQQKPEEILTEEETPTYKINKPTEEKLLQSPIDKQTQEIDIEVSKEVSKDRVDQKVAEKGNEENDINEMESSFKDVVNDEDAVNTEIGEKDEKGQLKENVTEPAVEEPEKIIKRLSTVIISGITSSSPNKKAKRKSRGAFVVTNDEDVISPKMAVAESEKPKKDSIRLNDKSNTEKRFSLTEWFKEPIDNAAEANPKSKKIKRKMIELNESVFAGDGTEKESDNNISVEIIEDTADLNVPLIQGAENPKKRKKHNMTVEILENDADLSVSRNKEHDASVEIIEKDNAIKRLSLEVFANAKLDEYIARKMDDFEEEDEENSSCSYEESESGNSFVDDMAEEGEEDTPSEDSNAIIDEGEAINSDSERSEDHDYSDDDSFICDEEHVELLPGEEYDLEDRKEKKRKSRIIDVEHRSEDVIKIERKQTPKPKRRSRIIKVDDSNSSSDEDVVFVDSNVPTEETSKRNRRSSINIIENIDVKEIRDAALSSRINQLVDSFCTTIPDKGGVSMNLSLEFAGKGSSKEETTTKRGDRKSLISTEASTSKRKSIESLKRNDDAPLKQRKLSVSLIEDSNAKRKKHKRKLSKSADDIEVESKKNKRKKSKKPIKTETKYLREETYGLMNQLLNDVKNRPRRVLQPSTTKLETLNSSWVVENDVQVKPSTTIASEKEMEDFKKKKCHPKDFRQQMLHDSSRVKRIETKQLLKKKGVYN